VGRGAREGEEDGKEEGFGGWGEGSGYADESGDEACLEESGVAFCDCLVGVKR